MKNAETLTTDGQKALQVRPRKYYSMTSEGETVLKALEASWDQFVDSVNSLSTAPNKSDYSWSKHATYHSGDFCFTLSSLHTMCSTAYLADLKQVLRGAEGKDDILQEVEHRLAELFTEFMARKPLCGDPWRRRKGLRPVGRTHGIRRPRCGWGG